MSQGEGTIHWANGPRDRNGKGTGVGRLGVESFMLHWVFYLSLLLMSGIFFVSYVYFSDMMRHSLTESFCFFAVLHCTFLIYLCPLFPYSHLYVFPHFVSPFCPLSSEALKGPYGYPFTVNLPMYFKLQWLFVYGRILHCIHR
jgi:hypothetical protein